uniref:Uncharacterized protein n=1 Tax=Populus alba TaxID=43335 RepID=A0A4U5LSQ0_POPAL|nr:hypothetical protein D5086_0000326340 [Populus alba]
MAGAVVGFAAVVRGALAAVVHSTGFVVERRVLAMSCHVWAAESPVRTVLLQLTMKTVGLQGEAVVEMGTNVEQGGKDVVVEKMKGKRAGGVVSVVERGDERLQGCWFREMAVAIGATVREGGWFVSE